MNEQKPFDTPFAEGDDGDLRARFGELRGLPSPSFAAVMQRASAEAEAQPALHVVSGRPSRRRVITVGAWASAALAATVAGLLIFDRGPNADEQFADLVAAYSTDMAAGAWQSPTTGLLNVPGMELTRAMPAIGRGR